MSWGPPLLPSLSWPLYRPKLNTMFPSSEDHSWGRAVCRWERKESGKDSAASPPKAKSFPKFPVGSEHALPQQCDQGLQIAFTQADKAGVLLARTA